MIKSKKILICVYQEDSMKLLRLIFFVFMGNMDLTGATQQSVLVGEKILLA